MGVRESSASATDGTTDGRRGAAAAIQENGGRQQKAEMENCLASLHVETLHMIDRDQARITKPVREFKGHAYYCGAQFIV